MVEKYRVKNCVFQNNNAAAGGAIFTDNVKIRIENCEFTNNSAWQDNGGALYLNCADYEDCVIDVVNNVFTRNRAEVNGGAIKWNDIMPRFLTSNQFTENVALYGNDIASFPVKIQRVNTTGRLLEALPTLPSGQSAGVQLEYALIDHIDQVVKSDNSSEGEIMPYDSHTTVSGSTKITATDGILKFSDY